MFSLNNLQDQTLRRLYKFILKRVLGQYLESELLLEQLDVQSRQGTVVLRDLRLNTAVLNEYLSNSPFVIIEAEVAELEASISYNTLLCDGCNVVSKGVRVLVAPTTHHSRPSRLPKMSKNSEGNRRKPPSDPVGISAHPDEDDGSLGFIAQWIEVVIARLKVSIEDLHIVVLESSPLSCTAASIPAVHLQFKGMNFHNSHPGLLRGEGGSVATASVYASSSSSYSFSAGSTSAIYSSTKKLVTLESLSVDALSLQSNGDDEIMPPLDVLRAAIGNGGEVLHLGPDGKMEIQCSPVAGSALALGTVDVDLSFPALRCHLSSSKVGLLVQVLSAYLESGKGQEPTQEPGRKSHARKTTAEAFSDIGSDILRLEENLHRLNLSHTLSALSRLEQSESDGMDNSEINFSRLSHLMQQYQLTRERLMREGHDRLYTQATSEIKDMKNSFDLNDSDVEFPDDISNGSISGFDDDDDEFEFHDTSEGFMRSGGRRTKDSAMSQSLYGASSLLESHMFHTADTTSANTHSETGAPRHRGVSLSTESVNLSRSQHKAATATGSFIRLFIEEVEVTFENDRDADTLSESILLHLGTAVVQFAVPSAATGKQGDPPSPSLRASVADISLLERTSKTSVSFRSSPLDEGNESIPQYVERRILHFTSAAPDESSMIIPEAGSVVTSGSHPSEGNTVIPGPLLTLHAALRPYSEGGTTVAVDLQHARCEFSVAVVSKWSGILAALMVPTTTTSSPFSFSCTIKVKSIDALLLVDPSNDPHHCDYAGPAAAGVPNWSTMSSALGFAATSKWTNPRWKKLKSVPLGIVHQEFPKIGSAMGDVPGCVRVVAGGLHLTFTSCNVSTGGETLAKGKPPVVTATSSSTTLEVDRINCFLRLSRLRRNDAIKKLNPYVIDTWELGFLSISGDGKVKKVSVMKEKYSGPVGLEEKGDTTVEESVPGLGERFEMPQLDIGEVIAVDAYAVRADLRQLENSALISVIRALSPSMPPLSSEEGLNTGNVLPQSFTVMKGQREDGEMGTTSPVSPTVLGVRVSSDVLTVRLSQDAGLNCSNPADSDSNRDASKPQMQGPLCYCLSVRQPLLEVYSSSSNVDGFKQYVGLMASDLSLYEMSTSEAEGGCGRGDLCKGARFWEVDGTSQTLHNIPFIHRTSLETSWMGEAKGTPDGTRRETSGVFQRPTHRVLSARIIVCEEPSTFTRASSLSVSQALALKTTHIHLSLCDMTYRFDPFSRWFSRIPELFSQDAYVGSGPSPETPPPVTQFGKTRITVSVRKLLVDICQPHLHPSDKADNKRRAESRMLISVGHLGLSSTLVSNSPRIGLKLSVKDLSLRVGNVLTRDPKLEQSPVDICGMYPEEYTSHSDVERSTRTTNSLTIDFDSFLDSHSIVRMGTVDYLDCRLDLNSMYRRGRADLTASRGPVAMAFELAGGTCFFYGCADSLRVLVDTLASLSQYIPAESNEDDRDDDTVFSVSEQGHYTASSDNCGISTKLHDPQSEFQCDGTHANPKTERVTLIPSYANNSGNAKRSVVFFDASSSGSDAEMGKSSDSVRISPLPLDDGSVASVRAAWMKDVDEDMFRPRAKCFADSTDVGMASTLASTDMDVVPLSTSQQEKGCVDVSVVDNHSVRPAASSTSGESKDTSEGGLQMAVIEDFYQGAEVDDSPEYEARYFPHYDYDDDDESRDVEMSGFYAMDEDEETSGVPPVVKLDDMASSTVRSEGADSLMSGVYDTNYSDSDGEFPEGREDDPRQAASMWNSWGALRTIGAARKAEGAVEDMELSEWRPKVSGQSQDPILGNSSDSFDGSNSCIEKSASFDIVSSTERRDDCSPPSHKEEGYSSVVYESSTAIEDTSRTVLTVAEGVVDEDMQRAWLASLEGADSLNSEQRAGWYDSAAEVPTKIIPHHIPIPVREDSSDITDNANTPSLSVQVRLTLRVRLFAGREWEDKSTSRIVVAKNVSAKQEMNAKGTGKSAILRSALFPDNSQRRTYRPNIVKHLPPSQKRRDIGTDVKSRIGRRDADSTEISLKSISVKFRLYPRHNRVEHANSVSMPVRSIHTKVHDLLVSYAQVGKKAKKILGNWKNYQKPIESHRPIVEVSMLGYDVSGLSSQQSSDKLDSEVGADIEYRMVVSVLPLRCYLDGMYVDFLKSFVLALVPSQPNNPSHKNSAYGSPQRSSTDAAKKNVVANVLGGQSRGKGSLVAPSHNQSEATHVVEDDDEDLVLCRDSDLSCGAGPQPPTARNGIYFQSWKVNVIELKIDYSPKQLDMRALQAGDYTQILNLFSIDGLEITLTKVNLTGISGLAAGVNRCLEEWVNEIYAHQIHRLLSSASPLRGISTIGANIQGLVLIPVKEYKKGGAAGVLKALQKESISLFKTVTRETLHASHQVSHFIANSLVDLVSPDGVQSGRRSGRQSMGDKQPTGFIDSLDRAYEAVSREIHSALDTVVVMPVRQYQRTGTGGYVRSVIRALPVAVLRPTAGAAEALSYTLLGLRNNIDPSVRRDEEDKWNVDHSGVGTR
mmetsp:Transcript_23429/g.34384  ORF Transcript_23429/g.34384 Transcript_23429/m.34384 type:complete len:2514 (+) Transcript_23429:183-7724(+)|eukprot:CAMPEP_0185033718 /NCGR_PEP_ID=MMETSP1103-20130426/22957_1 /TAXON_ID=36769 /ORGANISM="Paraphysomonas bandaiensis, Strain Caron Lab Isolate" /LENGTH=2513 /DNA_ID=CAMNT_0027570097 /DNA_START=99 /DNA_END=7640 /DNA_ORIENTATION=+